MRPNQNYQIPGNVTIKNTPSKPTCYRLDECQSYLRDKYSSLALVSHPRHLQQLDFSDETTLIVTCNWLLWQKAIVEGRHCIHVETHRNGDVPHHLTTEIYVRSNDWMYVDGVDATMFRGVSLGRKFIREIQYASMEQDKFRIDLTNLVEKYSPKTIVFYDFRTEYSVLGAPARFALISRLADDLGINVTDRMDTPDPTDPEVVQVHRMAPPPPAFSKLAGRMKPLFLWAIELLSEAVVLMRRVFHGKRPRILLMTSHMVGIPLLEGFNGKGVVPLYLAKWFPRKSDFRFLLKSIFKGIFLVPYRDVTLSKEDHQTLDDIRERLENVWSGSSDGTQKTVQDYISKNILNTSRLADMARDVIWARQMLDRHRPDVVFTDGLQTPLIDTILEQAKPRGIKTAATWTAHALLDFVQPALGGDPRFSSTIDYFFTWGKGHEDWLDATRATSRPLRTGSPILINYSSMTRTPRPNGRVLLLQYSASYSDACWPQSKQYEFFVNAIRMLQEQGYREIHFKLHPRNAETLGFHQNICRFFGLNCKVFNSGPFKDFVEWADVIIGPVFSGAMLEVMSSGKPYYPVLLPPNAADKKYLKGCPIYSDVESLRKVLESGEYPDISEILNYFTSRDEIADPVARIWELLENVAMEETDSWPS